MQRNNFSLLKVFIARWQKVPAPLEAVAIHMTAGGPTAAKGAKGRLAKPIADQRTLGLRIFAAGELLRCKITPGAGFQRTDGMQSTARLLLALFSCS